MLIFYFIGVILSKKISKLTKKVTKRDFPKKGAFLKKFGKSLRAMHLKENYEMEELYFSLSHYSIHHFSILFKR